MSRSPASVKRTMIAIAIGITCCGVLLALTQSAALAVDANDTRQWRVENSDTVEGNGEYQLHNMLRRTLNLSSQLGYIRGKYHCSSRGEYGWPGSSGGHFIFVRHNRDDHSLIRDSEAVAIFNTLANAYMINVGDGNGSVKFSSRPSFEWMLHRIEGPHFALYNANSGDYLVLNSIGVNCGPAATHGLIWLKILKIGLR